MAGVGGRAKVRTGGVSAPMFPTPNDLGRFLHRAAAHKVPFKATAGLHHAMRSDQPLVGDERQGPVAMHGFLNVFLAAGLARADRVGTELLETVLAERAAGAFAFDQSGVNLAGRRLTCEDLAATRRRFAISYRILLARPAGRGSEAPGTDLKAGASSSASTKPTIRPAAAGCNRPTPPRPTFRSRTCPSACSVGRRAGRRAWAWRSAIRCSILPGAARRDCWPVAEAPPVHLPPGTPFPATALNALMAGGREAAAALRRRLSDLLGGGTGLRGPTRAGVAAARRARRCEDGAAGNRRLHRLLRVDDHATNVGRMFRPDNPLLPNYK